MGVSVRSSLPWTSGIGTGARSARGGALLEGNLLAGTEGLSIPRQPRGFRAGAVIWRTAAAIASSLPIGVAVIACAIALPGTSRLTIPGPSLVIRWPSFPWGWGRIRPAGSLIAPAILLPIARALIGASSLPGRAGAVGWPSFTWRRRRIWAPGSSLISPAVLLPLRTIRTVRGKGRSPSDSRRWGGALAGATTPGRSRAIGTWARLPEARAPGRRSLTWFTVVAGRAAGGGSSRRGALAGAAASGRIRTRALAGAVGLGLSWFHSDCGTYSIVASIRIRRTEIRTSLH